MLLGRYLAFQFHERHTPSFRHLKDRSTPTFDLVHKRNWSLTWVARSNLRHQYLLTPPFSHSSFGSSRIQRFRQIWQRLQWARPLISNWGAQRITIKVGLNLHPCRANQSKLICLCWHLASMMPTLYDSRRALILIRLVACHHFDPVGRWLDHGKVGSVSSTLIHTRTCWEVGCGACTMVRLATNRKSGSLRRRSSDCVRAKKRGVKAQR